MTKTLKAIIFFIVLFLGGQWVIVQVLQHIIDESQFRFSKLYKSGEVMDYDMISIGNSRTLNSFYTPYVNDNYDVSAYNLAYNGMTMRLTEAILDDYLQLLETPDFVIVEISHVFSEHDNNEASNYNIYSNRSENIRDLIGIEDPKLSNVTKCFPLFRYNNEILYRSLFYLNKSDQTWINRYSITEDYVHQISEMKDVELAINDKHAKALVSIKKLIHDYGAKAVFFLAPYHPVYVDKINNIDQATAEIEILLKSPLIDLSRMMSIPTEGYADKIHTNHIGATYISDTLMQILRVE